MKELLYLMIFFIFFFFASLIEAIEKQEDSSAVILAGGINTGKGSRYSKFLQELEKSEIRKRWPPARKLKVVGEFFIPGILIAGGPAPEVARVSLSLRDDTTTLLEFPTGTKIWFVGIDEKEKKPRRDIFITGFSSEKPYRVEEPVKRVIFKGEEIISNIIIISPEDFFKEFCLKVCVSIP